MVPDLSRRQVIGGSLLTGLAGGAAFLPARWLPRGIAVQRTRLRPIPEMTVRPPVTDAHVAEARRALADAVERAEAAVDGLDGGQESPTGVRPESSLSSARSHLESARTSTGWDALFDARLGTKWAGEAIGATRVLTGEASGEFLAGRARAIQDRVADVRARIAHEVDDPSRGLARLYWVEKWLGLAVLNSYRDGTYVGQDEPTTEYGPHDVVRTWGSHLQARRTAADGARLRADYREGLDDPRPLATHVASAATDLETEARRRTPDRDEFEERTGELEALDPGPYRTLAWQLFYARQTADVRVDEGPWAGLPLYRAVENAETVLTCRGAAYARERAGLEPGDGSVPAGELAAAKREGLALLRERRRAARDRPVLELLLREGRRLLWAGDTDLEGRHDQDHPQARAYGKYLRAVGYLRDVGAVAARVDRPGAS